MEINDIIKLMQAVSENGLTSFKIEEGNLKLSIKKEKEVQQIVTVAGTPAPQIVASAGMAGEPVCIAGGTELLAQSAPQSDTPAAAEAGSGAAGDVQAGGAIDSDRVVASPLVGTFYHSASPEAEPFVKVGDTVKKGQTLGIIEAMKLMNEIESEFDGVVEAILVNNEDVVEYGQPLFRIR